jgi:O-antigen/teichoic acid export membrane protein
MRFVWAEASGFSKDGSLNPPFRETHMSRLGGRVARRMQHLFSQGRRAAGGGRGTFTALQIAQYVVLFIGTLLVTRALGPVGRAQYAVVLAVAMACQAICGLTLEVAASRLFARREATIGELCRLLSFATLVLSVVASGLTLVIGWLGQDAFLAGASTTSLLVGALTVPFVMAMQMAGYALLLVDELRFYASVRAGAAVIQTASVALLVVADRVTPETALATVAVGWAAIAVPFVWRLSRKVGRAALKPRWERDLGGRLIRTGLTLHAGSIALGLGVRIDLLIVSGAASPVDAGLYSLALTVADAAYFGARTVAYTALPRQMNVEDESEAIGFTLRFGRALFIVGAATAALTAVLADPFISVAFGEEWEGAVVPLVILVGANAAIGIETPLRNVLVRVGRPGAISVLACAGLVLNAGLTLALVGPFGIVGAAAASVIAYWVYTSAIAGLLLRAAGLPWAALIVPNRYTPRAPS